jgi:hypothetical protein
MVGLTRFMKCFGCQREIVDGWWLDHKYWKSVSFTKEKLSMVDGQVDGISEVLGSSKRIS